MSMASDFIARTGTSVSDLASALSRMNNKVETADVTRWTFEDGSTIEIEKPANNRPSHNPLAPRQENAFRHALWM
ncbi:hypothetical protein EC845_0932 [Comamonas sp. BIGb0124]|uniref:hypothetical protein n=1 Tax=Comamonas sp. BIGb0124 TaxID=2485130 RepID=UPI000F4736C2|nr:hypothetical protein [Comamonas sp. BIGb0124]ROR24898.1 hypothetical protein EC845_0932 [Comamonas sp. BIGb0124]